MVFPPILNLDDYYRAKVGKSYHLEVINPDEERFLLSTAFEHMSGAEPGSMVGERVEFIVEGKAVVEYGEARKVWEEYQRREKAT